MKTEIVDPTAIKIPHRLRAVDTAKVTQLAESMAAIGLQQPVTVWSPVDGECVLVAGLHRVKAACELGWKWIDTIFADDMTEIDRQLWEIDENLMRAELNPTELGEHITRRGELWKARAEVGGQSLATHDATGRKKTPQQAKGFAADTAEKTGMSKSATNLAKSRTEKIPEDVRDQIKGTNLDTGGYLDWIKKMDPEDQRIQVTCDLAEGVKPKIPTKSKAAPDPEPVVDWFEALKRDWGMASKDERKLFDDWRQDK